MRTKIFYILFSLLLLTGKGFAQCTVSAGNDTVLCNGNTLQLNATPGFTSYSWSPAAGLNNPNIANPVATVTGSTTYVVTASTNGTNLITNPDFSLGNTGFTSAYNFTSIYSPWNYYVNNDWFGGGWNLPDHTPTTDNFFMSVDGAGAPIVLWETTVAVMPNTNYQFNFWASRADQVQPTFEIHFIGNASGNNIVNTVTGIAYTGVFTWDQYGAPLWNSGTNTSLTIRIHNLQTNGYGNDFGLDDFSFTGPACTATDTITITSASISATLAGDNIICEGETATITASGGNTYQWSNGATTAAITVTPSVNTTYTVDISNAAGCTETLSHAINVSPAVTATVSGNTSLCAGESVTLTASGGPDFLWSNGSTNASITVSPLSNTTYTVIVTDAACADTTQQTVAVTPIPAAPATNNISACQYDILSPLTATGQNLTWYAAMNSTGSSNAPTPSTDETGITQFYVTQSINSCESNPSIITIEVDAAPIFELGPEVFSCQGTTIEIGPSNSTWQYNWSDGENTSPRTFEESAMLTLTATNQCGTFTDAIEIKFEECGCYYYLPNAFSPNGDGINEVYRPEHECVFSEYELMIFNRWGELVFQTNDPDEGWDGKYKGILSQQDVYVVKVHYLSFVTDSETKDHYGHVVLIR